MHMYFYCFFLRTKCHEKKSSGTSWTLYPNILGIFIFIFIFCLGAEIFELKEQKPMASRPFFAWCTFIHVSLRTNHHDKHIFLLSNIRHTASLNPGMFFSTCTALPLFDWGVHPEGLGIVVDKKLLNTSC